MFSADQFQIHAEQIRKAMKVVGATLAARLAARGMIKRSSGKKEKGELGKK